MRIWHVVPSLEELHGGPSKSVLGLARAQAQAGHAVSVLTTAPDAPRAGIEAMDPTGVTVRTFHRDFPRRVCASAGLKHALRHPAADLVQHHSLWLRTLHYAHRAAARASCPLVVSPRGMMSPWAWQHHGGRKRLARWLIHPGALESASGWHVTSLDEENDLRRLGFRQRICLSPNGVTPPLPEEMEQARRYWIEQCPEAGQRPTALFYSRFHRKKRLLELVETWSRVAPAEWLLLIVGQPEQYAVEEIEQHARDCCPARSVRVFSGLGRPAPYAVASLFLLPSHSENFGLVIAEAMAHGVPVVVTDTTPWQELNDEGRGWCVPWTDFGAACRDAMQETPAQLQARGRRARDWVLATYSWQQVAKSLTAFYSQLQSPS